MGETSEGGLDRRLRPSGPVGSVIPAPLLLKEGRPRLCEAGVVSRPTGRKLCKLGFAITAPLLLTEGWLRLCEAGVVNRPNGRNRISKRCHTREASRTQFRVQLSCLSRRFNAEFLRQ